MKHIWWRLEWLLFKQISLYMEYVWQLLYNTKRQFKTYLGQDFSIKLFRFFSTAFRIEFISAHVISPNIKKKNLCLHIFKNSALSFHWIN